MSDSTEENEQDYDELICHDHHHLACSPGHREAVEKGKEGMKCVLMPSSPPTAAAAGVQAATSPRSGFHTQQRLCLFITKYTRPSPSHSGGVEGSAIYSHSRPGPGSPEPDAHDHHHNQDQDQEKTQAAAPRHEEEEFHHHQGLHQV